MALAEVIQFNFLNGNKAGASWVARRFPVRVGRAAGSDLQVVAEGVWDDHFHVRFQRGEGFLLVAQPQTLTRVNGQPVEQAILHNGDVVEAGSQQLRFWLAPARQASLGWREWVTWAGIAAISALEILLVYWLRA